jgi:hypothetical protein
MNGIEPAFFQPYAPESNPDEHLNSDFKATSRTDAVNRDAMELMEEVSAFVKLLCAMSDRVRACFRYPCAAFSAPDV